MDAPNFVSEKNEPRNIKQNGAEEKEGISSAEALTATFDCNQREQCDCQIYEQHTVVQCSQ